MNSGSPPSANCSSHHASSPGPIDGEGTSSPDPRWPSLHRWSAKKSVQASPAAGTVHPSAAVSTERPPASGPTAATTPGKETPKTPPVSVLNEPAVNGEIPTTAPPLKGAWVNKLNIQSASASQQGGIPGEVSRWPSLSEAREICSQKGSGTQAFETKAMEDNQRFPWAAKMNPASRNLYRASEPEYLEDGTPKVTIPPEVMLQGIENQRDYILGQFYRCSAPSGGLVYAVFNKLWGRNCRITIQKLSDSTYLFHVPDESTRKWVLQRGLWHVDDCLMFVASWTPEASLEIPEIKTIPVWVTLKKIPNILYSIPGISHIASGLGAPMATHKPRLDPINMGEAKILVEVELSKAFPSRIAAGDKSGFISMVDVHYAWLPGTCSRCGQLGHKPKRCLQAEDKAATIVNTSNHSNENGQSGNPLVETTKPTTSSSVPGTSAVQSKDISIEKSGKSQSTLKSAGRVPAKATPFIEGKEIAISAQVVSPEIPVGLGLRRTLSSGALDSNRFSTLDSSDEEVSSDEEDVVVTNDDPEPTDILTPYGKRILRERPVLPSTKAKDMQWHPVGGGRGNRGRSNRRGRGRARG